MVDSCSALSVLSVSSVVLACKITTEYTEDTEKSRNKIGKSLRTHSVAMLSAGVDPN